MLLGKDARTQSELVVEMRQRLFISLLPQRRFLLFPFTNSLDIVIDGMLLQC